MLRFLLILLAVWSVSMQAGSLDLALKKAHDRQLSEQRYWRILLHMNNGISEVDSPDFFLADHGKTDADAELRATLNAFYNETRFDDNATGCRFPARRAWLASELGLEDLPMVHCEAYETLLEQVDPQSVTLVFSSAHINSPASMFGHTFLRIDSSYESKMLSHAINYAAAADPGKENGVVFALKGLFGGYPGVYSLLPYYEKLKEYRDTEQRDVWEYDLNLEHEELMKMMRHIWELRLTYNWYYFFDENCSYSMLWLLEAARPDVHLREHFIYHVIPMETVHAVEAEGLVSRKHYRPSKRKVLLAYEQLLGGGEIASVKAIVGGKIPPQALLEDRNLTVQTKRYILEAASELAQYHLMKGDIDRPSYLKRFHAILKARATLGVGERIAVAQPRNPDEGHRAARLRFQTGWREGLPVQMLGIRPAYHDLTDSDVGFLEGTQIEFADLLFRYDRDGAAVEKATIVSIVSIVPESAFFKPFSWRMHVGWDQSHYADKTTFNAGVGAGYSLGGSPGYAYFMVDPEGYVGQNAEVALKGSAGGVLYLFNGSKLLAEGGYRAYDTGERQWLAHAVGTFRLTQNRAVKLSYDYVDKTVAPQRTFKISYDCYF